MSCANSIGVSSLASITVLYPMYKLRHTPSKLAAYIAEENERVEQEIATRSNLESRLSNNNGNTGDNKHNLRSHPEKNKTKSNCSKIMETFFCCCCYCCQNSHLNKMNCNDNNGKQESDNSDGSDKNIHLTAAEHGNSDRNSSSGNSNNTNGRKGNSSNIGSFGPPTTQSFGSFGSSGHRSGASSSSHLRISQYPSNSKYHVKKSSKMELEIRIIASQPEAYQSWNRYICIDNAKDSDNINHFDIFATHLVRYIYVQVHYITLTVI